MLRKNMVLCTIVSSYNTLNGLLTTRVFLDHLNNCSLGEHEVGRRVSELGNCVVRLQRHRASDLTLISWEFVLQCKCKFIHSHDFNYLNNYCNVNQPTLVKYM